jgi:hypothetical protein
MENINPYSLLNNWIDSITPNYELTIHINDCESYIFKKGYTFILSDGDDEEIINTNDINIIKNFFIGKNITEIDLNDKISNTSKELYIAITLKRKRSTFGKNIFFRDIKYLLKL